MGARAQGRDLRELQPESDAITAESDLWKGSTLNPLFFTGTGVFGKVDDTWTANVNLTRQVAKLRIKAGIHPDAVPSTLEIDPRSISVTVEKRWLRHPHDGRRE